MTTGCSGRHFATLDRSVGQNRRATVVPPGNRLEALKGDRAGQYSIRINDRYRVCFRWTPAGPEGVEIVDYH
jgi:plasmid maintenance system killer protein